MSVVTHSGETEDSKTAEVAAEGLDALVGQTLDGRFRIVEVIGKGAMGKVYRAVQVPLNRAVALKVLDSRYGAGREESFKQRFLVEAALTSKLNHPNTVRVVDYGSTKDGLFFLAMEYLDGQTLEVSLSKGALSWRRALSIGQQIARALREAHELGVVHRDLKPANVVMLHADDDTDFVKVLDFGLVKSFIEGQELEGRAITQQGMLMGSPPYMAPEQGERNRADPRSDIYSLGTMLFEMLTGKPPFNGVGALEVILKHVHEALPPIVTPAKFEKPPEALITIVKRCLAKSPMDRFQSMDELLLAMQDVAPAPSPNAPRVESSDFPPTDALVPVTEVPTAEEAIEHAPGAQRSSIGLLLLGFLVAAAVGVFATWLLTPSQPIPKKLSIHVESTPPGATVTVDGKALGFTPLELEQGLSDGRGALELTLEKEGFAKSVIRLASPGGLLEVSQVLSELPPLVVAPVIATAPPASPASPVLPVLPAPSAPEPIEHPEKKLRAPRLEARRKANLEAAGVRPASRLDDEEEPASAKSELKHPAP